MEQQSAHPLTQLRVERQWGQLLGTNIRTFDGDGRLVCFSQAKAFKLKEDIAFFEDEAKTKPLFRVKARNVIDIAATYDMIANDGQVFGSLRRKGLMSAFAQDHWFILDAAGNTVGEIMEDSALLGVIRRFVDYAAYFLPQKYTVRFGDQPVATIQQRRNPFTVKYDYAIDSGVFGSYRQLFLAISALLAIIEARQN